MIAHSIRRASVAILVWLIVSAPVFAQRGKPHLKTFVQCDRLADEAGGPLGICTMRENPEEVWVEPAHVHDLTVVPQEARGTVRIAVPRDSVVRVDDRGNGIFRVTGRTLGVTELTITHQGRAHRDPEKVRIVGVSPRVTVVGWINSAAIDLDVIAPKAGDQIKEYMRVPARCLYALAHWNNGYRYGIRNDEDATWARAFLIKQSGNQPPPAELTADFLNRKDYKIIADFRTSRDAHGRFLRKPFVHAAHVGRTEEPCSLLPGQVADEKIFSLPGELHETHGKQFSGANATTFVNQTRIHKKAQAVNRTLTNPKRETPWIWAKVTIDRDGRHRVCAQRFPTYTIYKDGKKVDEKKQSNLAEFLKLDHNSQTSGEDCPQ